MRLRARRQVDKEARRRAILDAAVALWAESTFSELTMSAVAERAGLVKGTLYLYFATKEELLLELVEEHLRAWFDELDRRLERPQGDWDAERTARILTGSLQGREALIRLLILVGGVLEHNIGAPRARAYKELLRARVTRTGGLLAQRLPYLGVAGAVRVLFQFYALLTGFGEMAYPAPVVRAVIREPGFEMFRVDVIRELSLAVGALLRGVEAGRRGGRVEPRRRAAAGTKPQP